MVPKHLNLKPLLSGVYKIRLEVQNQKLERTATYTIIFRDLINLV